MISCRNGCHFSLVWISPKQNDGQNIPHAFVMNVVPLSASFFLRSGPEDNSQTSRLCPPSPVLYATCFSRQLNPRQRRSTRGLMPGETNSQMAFNTPLTEGCGGESLSKLRCYYTSLSTCNCGAAVKGSRFQWPQLTKSPRRPPATLKAPRKIVTRSRMGVV